MTRQHTALEALNAASEFIRSKFGAVTDVRAKGGNPLDLVTEADKGSEERILLAITKAFPDDGFFSEEAGKNKVDAEHVWVIDPLDGTTNFVHEIPCFSVSIALTAKGETVFGCIANPITNEIFHAEKGKGATMNGSRIRVSATQELAKAFVTAEWWSRNDEFISRGKKIFNALADQSKKIRYISGTVWGLSRIARGLFDIATCDTSFLDVAAAALIIEEAGGKLTNNQGEVLTPDRMDIQRIVAANPVLHKAVLELIEKSAK